MDNNTLIEMARLITKQQTEIDRLKKMLPINKKDKKKFHSESIERRLCLITKMYQKQWEITLTKNSEKIAYINQQLMTHGLDIFMPNMGLTEILKKFK